MTSLSSAWFCQVRGFRGTLSADTVAGGKPGFNHLQTSFLGSFPAGILQVQLGFSSVQKSGLLPCIKCEKEDEHIRHISVERPPYHSYLDSTSGQLEPASGARASIPGQEYWPEGTADRVRAARAPAPTGTSSGLPSYGQKPGSRRRKHRSTVTASESSEMSVDVSNAEAPETASTEEQPKDVSSEYVVYQTEPEEELDEYDLDKKLGRPHPFIDPKVRKPIEGIRPNEELWWTRKKTDKEMWSRWQKRKPDVETVFLKAMAEKGEVKIFGEHPTKTEAALYRARKHLYKAERLQAEQERLNTIGPIAYYSEWVKAWKKDTSKEAIQKHFEETGEDENTQLLEMFCQQTDREYRIMMGTDTRIKRDPLAMRLREDQIKQIWGGDPVYPTINYIHDPDEVVDYRGADFHEPTPNMVDYLKEHGLIKSREEFEKVMAKEKTEEVEMTEIDDAMARAVDIGENDDDEEEDTATEEEEDDDDNDDNDDGEYRDADEKIDRNWSVLKTSGQPRKSKGTSKKNSPMSLKEAIEDSENLTDFLMDFEEEE